MTRRAMLLGGVLTMLVATLAYTYLAAPGPAASASAGARRAASRPAGAPEVDAVRLDALAAPRPAPEIGSRNPFRFRAAAPREAPVFYPGEPGPAGPLGPAAPVLPAGPPPPPPITLKFIGVVQQGPAGLTLAVMSDGRNVFYGREGDAIEGRYRLLRIGQESIEMAYLDGRGRQTIRLTGS